MRLRPLLAISVVAACGASDEPIELSDGIANVRRHAIAFDGENYAVAWATYTGTPTPAGDRLWFARVTPGRELDVDPVPVLDVGADVPELYLVARPDRFVVWYRRQDADGAGLFAVALDPAGAELGVPVDLGALRVSGVEQTFAVGWTGDRFVVATQHSGAADTEIHLAAYDAGLAPVVAETTLEVSTAAQYEPSVVWSELAAQVVVLWSEDGIVRTMRTDVNGTPAGPSATIADFGDAQRRPGSAAGGDALVAGWTDGQYRRRLRFAVAGPDATWRPHANLIPDSRVEPVEWGAAVRDGSATLVWSSDATTALPVIRAGRLALAPGAALDGVRDLTSARSGHFDPRIVAGIDESGVTYLGESDGARRLYFTTVE